MIWACDRPLFLVAAATIGRADRPFGVNSGNSDDTGGRPAPSGRVRPEPVGQLPLSLSLKRSLIADGVINGAYVMVMRDAGC
jgi:hypothetical protein